MNFFEAQDNARRKTWQLVALFAGAVVSLIVLTNLLVAAVVYYSNTMAYGGPASLWDRLLAMPSSTWVMISVLVVGMISVASLYKYLALRGGGRAIAEMLGGRQLSRDAADTLGKRTLNVVEEMAIASGLPVPPVYVIEEPSINAFAAGLSADDAVIGINRGTIEHLSRDELQGVVAHEFSHIINGDTRINLRLLAALHGIVFLSMIGHTILRGFRYSGGRRSDSSSNAPVVALGLGLLVIGYSGSFFGNLIKAAVSRQREYLADAAAVQFTRNPDGIADALKKIGGLDSGSKMTVAAAAEASHMFFGQVQRMFLNNIMATHPPLPKRIRAIDPGWDGRYIDAAAAISAPQATELAPGTSAFAEAPSRGQEAAPTPPPADRATAVVEEVGTLTSAGVAAAHRLIEATATSLRNAAHDPFGSRALVYALLLDAQAAKRQAQVSQLHLDAEAGVAELTEQLAPEVASLDSPHRLVLLEMSMPALKTLSDAQYRRFVGNCITLIKHDRNISLLEWVTHQLLLKELRPHFEGPRRVRSKHRNVAAVAAQAATLLSALARAGHPDDLEAAARAFADGAGTLDLPLTFEAEDDPDFQSLNGALKELRALKPLAKPLLLKGCAATALTDEVVNDDELTLLQGVAAALDCPLPPSIYADRKTRIAS